MAYFISISRVHGQIFQRILALCNLQILFEGFLTGMILVELQKVFDTLDHIELLPKMKCIGFKDSFISFNHISHAENFLRH